MQTVTIDIFATLDNSSAQGANTAASTQVKPGNAQTVAQASTQTAGM